jgi:hypothetical protein
MEHYNQYAANYRTQRECYSHNNLLGLLIFSKFQKNAELLIFWGRAAVSLSDNELNESDTCKHQHVSSYKLIYNNILER